MKNLDAFKLFFRRESKRLFGHRNICLWVTSCVFLLAILSVGFGHASMDYLKIKMSDPFVTCVDIVVSQIYAEKDSLGPYLQRNQSKYNYAEPEYVHFLNSDKFIDGNGRPRQLDGRTLSMKSPLKNSTILSPSNVICLREDTIQDSDFGIILSLDGLEHLSMIGERPTFLRRMVPGTESHFSVPILAIVKQLPNMCDYIGTDAYAQRQIANKREKSIDSYDITLLKYNKQLDLAVPDTTSEVFKTYLKNQYDIYSIEVRPYMD